MTNEIGFDAEACNRAALKIRDALIELSQETAKLAEHGGTGSWFVLGFHTPDMDESGIYATSSMSTKDSATAANALTHVFAHLLESELEDIEEQGFAGDHIPMLHTLGAMRHELDDESLPIDVLLRYETALMAHEGIDGPLSPEERAPVEAGLNKLLALHAAETAEAAEAEDA